MKLKYLLLLMIAFTAGFKVNAQTAKADSAQVAKTLHELLRICRTINYFL